MPDLPKITKLATISNKKRLVVVLPVGGQCGIVEGSKDGNRVYFLTGPADMTFYYEPLDSIATETPTV